MGLFSNPYDVQESQQAQDFNRGISYAQLSPLNVPTAVASQAGSMLGRGIMGGLGFQSPQEQKMTAVNKVKEMFAGQDESDPAVLEKIAQTFDRLEMHDFGQQARDEAKEQKKLAASKATERKTLKGADGFQYYADTGERVLPAIEADKTITMSNLGEHYRDALQIEGCEPGDKKCARRALDLVMSFKKPETAFTSGLGKGATDKLWDGFGKAEKARGSILAINSAMGELDKGTITGSFSGIRQDVSNMLYTMGLTNDPSIINTKKFIADTGKLVLNILGSGDLGAGTGLSDKDVEFANTVAGANTDIPPEALFKILDMNRRANQAIIDRHNKWADSVDPEQLRRAGIGGVSFTVKTPKYYKKTGVDPEGEMGYGDFIIK